MSTPKVRVHRPGGIIGVEKTLALRLLEPYCTENGLSYDKLSDMIFDIVDNVAMFMAPSSITPNGLLNDLETQPRLVLTIEDLNGKLQIGQTEYTSRYLSA